MKIEKVAFLWVCSCEEHGHIVLPNMDMRTQDFASKEEGLQVVGVLREVGLIAEDEAKVLTEQILGSNLIQASKSSDGLPDLGDLLSFLSDAFSAEPGDGPGQNEVERRHRMAKKAHLN